MAADVLILTGPPGSGKTTVARLLTAKHQRAVHIESDHFFHFIASGYIEPWKEGSHPQNGVVMDAVARAAATYATAGYFTVIDGIFSPRWFYPPVRDALLAAGCSVAYAILCPHLDVAISRAQARSASALADPEVIGKLWLDFSGLDPSFERHVFDTASETPEEAAQRVGDHLRAGLLNVESTSAPSTGQAGGVSRPII